MMGDYGQYIMVHWNSVLMILLVYALGLGIARDLTIYKKYLGADMYCDSHNFMFVWYNSAILFITI